MNTIVSPENDLLNGFREGFGRVAATVGIITFRDPDGDLCGMTATAISALSGEPPSLVAIVNQENRTFAQICDQGTFGVTFLKAGNEDLALQFSKPGADKRVLAGQSEELDGWPIPALRAAEVSIACELDSHVRQFTHGILIGKITNIRTATGPADPLLYMQRGFHRLNAA